MTTTAERPPVEFDARIKLDFVKPSVTMDMMRSLRTEGVKILGPGNSEQFFNNFADSLFRERSAMTAQKFFDCWQNAPRGQITPEEVKAVDTLFTRVVRTIVSGSDDRNAIFAISKPPTTDAEFFGANRYRPRLYEDGSDKSSERRGPAKLIGERADDLLREESEYRTIAGIMKRVEENAKGFVTNSGYNEDATAFFRALQHSGLYTFSEPKQSTVHCALADYLIDVRAMVNALPAPQASINERVAELLLNARATQEHLTHYKDPKPFVHAVMDLSSYAHSHGV